MAMLLKIACALLSLKQKDINFVSKHAPPAPSLI